MGEIAEECVGRWHGIYNSLGIEVGDGKHCKCPICGGKDRFRMDNKDGRGTFFCNNCGAGDGFALIQKVLGCGFKEAAKEIEAILGTVTSSQNIPKERTISKEYLRDIFLSSKPATDVNFVGAYLANRGLSVVPSCLRAHQKCHEPETNKKMPAMLGVFTSSDGEALTMHRTFLDNHGGKANIEKAKKILPGLKPLSGGAIRLFDIEDTVAIAEGIETAIAVKETMNIPCWSVVSTTLMAAFVPPKGIKNVIICGDNDKNFAGHKAAYSAANRLSLAGYNVSVVFPEKAGEDFLDELIRKNSNN